MELKAITTFYKGYKFRSRLEARWAVFFDEINVPWEYELEGFELKDGTFYLPDFLLRDSGGIPDLWLEVRPFGVKRSTVKVHKFADELITETMASEKPLVGVIIVKGEPLDACSFLVAGAFGNFKTSGEYSGKNGIPSFPQLMDSKTGLGMERIKKAALIARQARFEFGETPKGRI